MRYTNWEINGFDRDAAIVYYRSGINPLISVLLASRGITDIEEARSLLGEAPPLIYDPFLMTDMDKAVSRIRAAIAKGERIAIYGDYDVDGMTSCSILAHWLKKQNADYEIYIPGRLFEGYGLNRTALDTLKDHGVDLIVTVDCGITAFDEADYARSIGMSLVITDHHECRAQLPVADAVIDPKRPDCSYPHKALAGVGVVFKLVCALESDVCIDDMFRTYGDLVAIGTVADVMPVVGENRDLIRIGLAVINENPRPGLLWLMRAAYPERGVVTTATIGFTIAPRLNAGGRMGQAELSVGLLMTEDDAEAEKLAAELNRLNAERRRLEVEIYEEATALLPEAEIDGPIVLAHRGWYQGVTGIVAAKIAENHLRPAIIISIDDEGIGRGSCRSFGTFGIYGALRSCEDILRDFGGHEMAAGVTVVEENIPELRRRVAEYYRNSLAIEPEPGLKIDFVAEKPELLVIKNVEALEILEPFGFGNPPPMLCVAGAFLSAVYSIGAGKHTRFKIEMAGKTFDCIYFSMPSENLQVSTGMLVDVAFVPQINEFRGRKSVQLHVIDVRASE